MTTPSHPFNWQDYLRFARHLIDSIKSEAAARVAVSRAYYATYWRARRILEAGRAPVAHNRTHEFVWASFDGIHNAEGLELRELGLLLRDGRNWADYRDLPSLTLSAAETYIADAEELSDSLAALTAGQCQRACAAAASMFAYYRSH